MSRLFSRVPAACCRAGTLAAAALGGSFFAASVRAQTPPAPEESRKAAPPVTPAAPVEPAEPTEPFKYGVDAYLGTSNLAGNGRFTDGFWAGSAAAYPSVAYIHWENGRGSAAKLSLGTGRLYTGPESTVDQPVEAWWRTPLGKSGVSATIGQYWIPFAAQEWQYESKPGVMLSASRRAWDLSLSANYNRRTQSANTYARLGRRFGDAGVIGVSYGLGRGLSYNTDYDTAWAVDGTYAWRGWRISSEYDQMRGGGTSDPFYFAYGKLAYENLGAWKPFIGRYVWDDKGSGAFGDFRSTVYGLSFQATRTLTLEGAYAPASSKDVTWLQLHWVWER